MYEIIEITPTNVDEYDLFCLKSKRKKPPYQQKRQWFLDNYDKGLKIYVLYVDEGRSKLTSRGFIEFTPIETNWRGINGSNILTIHCLFVVGRNKNRGYGTQLLNIAIEYAKDQQMDGVAVLASKITWLTHPKFFLNHDFILVDAYNDDIGLYYYTIKGKNVPKLSLSVKPTAIPQTQPDRITVFRSAQCPYTYSMVNYVEKFAKRYNINFNRIDIEDYQKAQSGLHPYGTFYIQLDDQVYDYRPDTAKFVKHLTVFNWE